MTYKCISVVPLGPIIGAEVSGVDLSRSLGNQVFQEIHDALVKHQVIFFRDQAMTVEQHKAFGRLFGKLHVHPAAPATDGDEEVITIHADENSTSVSGGQMWHTDVSADAEPPMGSILHLREVPEPGGDTLFASMYAAYDALSVEMKKFLGGLKAWHSSEKRHKARYGHRGKLRDGVDTFPNALHPVVRTHPVSGRKALFVNTVFTTHIEGLAKHESDAVLNMLYKHIATPEFTCRFRWYANSVAFWDNRCTQHRALWDYYPAVRHGYRVAVCGDKPF
ncbi:MAG: Alpha-ketoglutarate-dependent taurine dioxygenase [Alphaproteobacteria bacterium MarineAlpha4_Bin2]|nr:MAG: Alpha-ketoglutarate-dependent taurine dioxygenase [Alphaproteobacteria bacterium MarineAlpha4_Bin2]